MLLNLNLRQLLVSMTVCAVFALSASAVSADPIVVNSGGNNVSGTIVAGNGTVTITLNNNLTNAQVLAITNNISAVYFQVSGYNLAAVGLSSSNSAASTTIAGGGGAATLGAGFNPTGWAAGHSGSTVTVCVICAYGINANPPQPAHTITGGSGTGTYANANGSIAGNGPHNPFLVGTVVFTLTVPGVTVNSTFSNVVVQFGTTATPPTTSVVPEPASMFLLGTGLVGIAAGIRRRRNRT